MEIFSKTLASHDCFPDIVSCKTAVIRGISNLALSELWTIGNRLIDIQLQWDTECFDVNAEIDCLIEEKKLLELFSIRNIYITRTVCVIWCSFSKTFVAFNELMKNCASPCKWRYTFSCRHDTSRASMCDIHFWTIISWNVDFSDHGKKLELDLPKKEPE